LLLSFSLLSRGRRKGRKEKEGEGKEGETTFVN
jgi:hypothetical protein